MNRPLSPNRIQVLPSHVANQIAAGEVVERPASVVKELLENSLDAGSHAIEIDIEKGGVQRIRIRDDGCGIHRDDLSLALNPHATSKITSSDDLAAVGTLGFRGEALASIASVSRLTLSSRQAGEESGWQLGSEHSQIQPVATLPGTEIEMRDLFYNTPARRRFLRSERTEFTYLEDVVRRIALSRFDLSLRLSHNGRQVLRVKSCPPSGDRARRVSEVLGRPFVDNSRFVEHAAEGISLWGWLGHSGYSRSHADTQYLYLNGRMIKDRLVAHAVRLAFGESIPEGRFPAYLLYLELDPHQVDVNVHPTKHEVRFREARQVHDFIYWVVKRALNDRDVALHSQSNIPEVEEIPPGQGMNGMAMPSYKSSMRPAIAESRGRYRQSVSSNGKESLADGGEPLLGRPLALIRSGYLLTERSDGSVIIDLRGVLEELMLARLQGASRVDLLTSQPLLIPHSRELTAKESAVWREQGEKLVVYGFEWGWLGEHLLVMRQVPATVRTAVMDNLLIALTQWLVGLGDRPTIDRLIAEHSHPDPLPNYGNAELNALLREYEGTMAAADNRHWRFLTSDDWRQLIESRF